MIWQNVSEKGTFFATTLSRQFKDQADVWRNDTLFSLNDLQALMNVAVEVKEWMTARAIGGIPCSFSVARSTEALLPMSWLSGTSR